MSTVDLFNAFWVSGTRNWDGRTLWGIKELVKLDPSLSAQSLRQHAVRFKATLLKGEQCFNLQVGVGLHGLVRLCSKPETDNSRVGTLGKQ